MKIIPTVGTILIAIGGSFYALNHNDLGTISVLLGISCLALVIYRHLIESGQQKGNLSTYLPGDSYMAISLAHPRVKLVIKSFSWKEHEFISFIDIANLTGINLNILFDIIKYLIVQDLITESSKLKEHYELSPKGADFANAHKKELSKIKLNS